MKTYSVAMIAEHAGREPWSVRRALKAHGIEPIKKKGVAGYRIPKAVADKFLAIQWPESGPMQTKGEQ